MIEVLFEGTHENHQHDGAYYSIDPLGSSVVLIQTEGQNILFDTSSMINREKLLAALRERGLNPEDINHVVCSHYHFDHTYNNSLFGGTAFIHTSLAFIDKKGSGHIFAPIEKRGLPSTIELLNTPGHTQTDVSLVYEWEEKVWICAGDAVREDLIRCENPLSTKNPEELIASMKLIFGRGDVIIPGHGRIISGALKDELKQLLYSL